ncbi:YdcF family protein [Leptolyngbya sp. NIES-2104]|uniref:YdcF family protein n=1 Tax=Leptolyngbya sp. NIES-2104 TaxID=1552121 RepID=UPI0006ECAECF|nr:YdcF family protein [Leptolyngbya sp. NIES-2104]GAP97586.1 hypothetical protein NIES2104_41330 [Leptolyngbya sp. NIES-2104]
MKRSGIRWACLSLLCAIGLIYGTGWTSSARQEASPSEIILVLGGGVEREQFAAQFAQQYPNLKIWVSTGTNQAADIFRSAGIDSSRVYLDCRATDTVTNFTTVATDFKHKGIEHVYVLTSAGHMTRATAIANVVFGSQNIAYTPVNVPSTYPEESPLRIARDVGRSVVWTLTGRTGASFNRRTAC